MATATTFKRKKNTSQKKSRELILNVSIFLLNQEPLKKLFWSVKSVNYDTTHQSVGVGISTTKGKYGTTLAKLRKCSRDLSDHLYENGLTFRRAKINFFINKEDYELERLYGLLADTERSLKE
jgi:hypothetical protein